MEFQTRIPLSKYNHPIDYDSKIGLLGSCFVENIGAKLAYYKFDHMLNPFGILFHPFAIAAFLEYVLQQRQFTEKDLIYHNERWHCYDAHSALSASVKGKALENLNSAVSLSRSFFTQSSHIIITLGTAWGYHLLKTQKWVANCHKMPQREFEKKLAPVQEITQCLHQIIKAIEELSPKASVIFTVSPVRHLKDGFVQNQRSKAHLLTAVHEVIDSFENAFYFPSYELMMDELRDYRFYDRDMLHPNAMAIDYIWEKFAEVALSPGAKKYGSQIEEIKKGIAHRPFDPESIKHKKFLEALDQKKEELLKKLPHISLF